MSTAVFSRLMLWLCYPNKDVLSFGFFVLIESIQNNVKFKYSLKAHNVFEDEKPAGIVLGDFAEPKATQVQFHLSFLLRVMNC